MSRVGSRETAAEFADRMAAARRARAWLLAHRYILKNPREGEEAARQLAAAVRGRRRA